MRSLAALYIDAGYLLHAAATRVAGTSLRSSVKVDYSGLIRGLSDQASRLSGLTVLRTNWYDSGAGLRSAPDATQTTIGMLPGVKLRLGRLSPNGDQKGVDVRMGLDLVTHARNNAIDVMYLLSGDDDLTEAVEEAQSHGVQVSLLGVPDREGHAFGVSLHLRQEADSLELIDAAVIDDHVTVAGPKPDTATTPSPQRLVTAPPACPDPTPSAADTESAPAQSDRATNPPLPGPPTDAGPIIPTPTILAGRSHRPEPIYRTATGQTPVNHYNDVEDLTEAADGVVRHALAAWRLTSTPDEVAGLLEDRPNIPQALDRALLNDMSTAMGVYELDETTRFLLRRRFWELASHELGGQGAT